MTNYDETCSVSYNKEKIKHQPNLQIDFKSEAKSQIICKVTGKNKCIIQVLWTLVNAGTAKGKELIKIGQRAKLLACTRRPNILAQN
jgi:hypothetical protein